MTLDRMFFATFRRLPRGVQEAAGRAGLRWLAFISVVRGAV